MAAIRNGILVLLICALPGSARAGCGLFSPCGSPSWIGFSLALPVPRLPHLHTFTAPGYQSPMCGLGTPVGCGLGCCPAPAVGPAVPPLSTPPPVLTPQPTLPPTSCNPCETFVPQQTMTYRDVPQIQYRQEPYTTTVPVTTYQQVTRYRSVPYQTTTRIPQVSTHYVPQVSSCDPCLTGTTLPAVSSAVPAVSSSVPAYSPTPSAQPQSGGVPEYPYPATQPQTNTGGDQWQTIPQRQARSTGSVEQTGYTPHAGSRSNRSSMFRPAPSATAVRQSRWMR